MTARVPSALKVVRGTDRPDRRNAHEPRPRAADTSARPPAWLKLSPLARRAWADIAPILREMTVLSEADRIALALLCDTLAEYVEAKRLVDAEGAVYWTKGKTVMQRTHPAVAIRADAWRRARLMLSEFGLTPAARPRVSGIPDDEATDAEFFVLGATAEA